MFVMHIIDLCAPMEGHLLVHLDIHRQWWIGESLALGGRGGGDMAILAVV